MKPLTEELRKLPPAVVNALQEYMNRRDAEATKKGDENIILRTALTKIADARDTSPRAKQTAKDALAKVWEINYGGGNDDN
jgi:hypothetical protein